jgi:hypothetical protein
MFIIVEMNGQLHVPAALSLENSLQYPIYRRVGAPQCRYEGRDKNI